MMTDAPSGRCRHRPLQDNETYYYGGSMSFNGFTDKTLEYFLTICLDNSKSNFEANRPLYIEHVRDPLRSLQEALVPIVLEIDASICVKPSRCISGAYNDARFSRSEPLKTYMYLHFCAETGREADIPGFFMDASYDGYRYGLQIYHRTTQGMQRLRDALLNNGEYFYELAAGLERRDEFMLEGECFKKDRYPDTPPVLKNWLNRKSWWIGRTCPPDEDFFTTELAMRLAEGFLSLQGLYRFINGALMTVRE